jgi:hypothetical protein
MRLRSALPSHRQSPFLHYLYSQQFSSKLSLFPFFPFIAQNGNHNERFVQSLSQSTTFFSHSSALCCLLEELESIRLFPSDLSPTFGHSIGPYLCRKFPFEMSFFPHKHFLSVLSEIYYYILETQSIAAPFCFFDFAHIYPIYLFVPFWSSTHLLNCRVGEVSHFPTTDIVNTNISLTSIGTHLSFCSTQSQFIVVHFYSECMLPQIIAVGLFLFGNCVFPMCVPIRFCAYLSVSH